MLALNKDTMNIQKTDSFEEVFMYLEGVDAKYLVKQHLEHCQFKINGYYSDESLYDEIHFGETVDIEIQSQSLRFIKCLDEHLIRLYIEATLILSVRDTSEDLEDYELAEISLSFNEKGEFIDENWNVNMDSPYIKKTVPIEYA